MSAMSYSDVKMKWLLLVLYFSALVLLVLRKSIVALTLPARWEDISVLLSPAIQHSWGSIFLIHYYYFHLIPTLVTFFSLQLLGIQNVLLGMNLTAIFIATLCSVFFATKQFRFIIKNDLLRAFCSLFVVLVPGITEAIYSNISSIQWFLNVFVALFAALLLFQHGEYERKSRKLKCLYAFFCIVSFLSSAFAVIFLPVFLYVIIRGFRNKSDLITLSSYTVPAVLLFVQAITIYTSYLSMSKPTATNVSSIIMSSVNGFTISSTKIFYYNTPDAFEHLGMWMYLIPIAIVAFVLLNSFRKGKRFEMFVLACIVATLFWSSVIKSSLIDWNCLCGQAQERYFFFAIVLLFVLILRQLDGKNSLPFKVIFSTMMVPIVLNIVSGFLIPIQADENWKYVTEFYDPSGKYQCYVGEPQGWSITIPCSQQIVNNVTNSSVTFIPPMQQTTMSIKSNSLRMIYDLPIKFIATVSPTPTTGTVQFYVDGISTGSPITIFGGQAIFNTHSLSVGQHKVSASYSGDPNFNTSASYLENVTVLAISNLSGQNLSGDDLRNANLSNVNLTHADLSGTNLEEADLKDAELEYANLQNADLQGANLENANLKNTNLSGAIIRDANTNGTNFAGAVVNGCNGCP